jgi:hypothetical protein
MKKIISILAIVSVIMVSCKKSFIEINPMSAVSVDAVYKTDKDFQDATTGVYSTYEDQYQNFWLFGDMRADDSWQQVIKNSSQYFMDVFTTNSSDGVISSTWLNYYKIIYSTNTILAKIETADAAVVTNKKRYIAEAKFLRALAYFDLVRIFGDVPLLTKPVTIDESYKVGREKVETIYTQLIIPDLIAAEADLPAKYTGTDIGRATKGAAASLIGKVYLYRKDFVNAEIKFQQVTTMGYSLLPVYNDLFNYTKDEHHSEYIFDIEYEQGIGRGSIFTNQFMPNSGPMATFYGINGTLQEANSPTQNLISAFTPTDLRKDITVGVSGGFINGAGTFVALPPQTSQTYTKKYLTPVLTGNDSRANWKVIRYGDVLLMYAEALNENNKTPQALTVLNQIRTRAGVPTYSGLTQDDTREKIYLERRLELSFEGSRWFDLVRTGRAFTTMKATGMLDYMTVFPVPLTQIQLINNPSIFPQNPGYGQ